MQDPQSLHKYAYVHGDPVQYDDPLGYGINSAIVRKLLAKRSGRLAVEASMWAIAKALIGTRATYTLGEAYIRENGRRSSDVDINKAIARLGDKDLPIDRAADNFVEQMEAWAVRPDIVDHTSQGEQYYEIKSSGEKLTGLADVLLYGTLLRERYPSTLYRPGGWSPRQAAYIIDAAYGLPVPLHITAWNEAPGLVLYQTNHNEDMVLAALIASEVAVEIASFTVKRLAVAGVSASSARGNSGLATAMSLAIIVGF